MAGMIRGGSRPDGQGWMDGIIVSLTRDRTQRAVILVTLTVVAILFLMGGICIWPYFFSKAFVDGAFDSGSVFGKAVIQGGISCGLGLLVSIFFCWFYDWGEDCPLTFTRVWMIVYMVEIIANWMLMIILGVDLMGAQSGSWIAFLSIMFHGILGLLMAVAPSFLAALLGYLANLLWYVTHKHLL